MRSKPGEETSSTQASEKNLIHIQGQAQHARNLSTLITDTPSSVPSVPSSSEERPDRLAHPRTNVLPYVRLPQALCPRYPSQKTRPQGRRLDGLVDNLVRRKTFSHVNNLIYIKKGRPSSGHPVRPPCAVHRMWKGNAGKTLTSASGNYFYKKGFLLSRTNINYD
jgi:hypothetical protein